MKTVYLIAKIEEPGGRIFICSSDHSPETSGLYHLIDKTDSFHKKLHETIAINTKAREKK